jgi:hypothetical protein
MIDWFDVMRRAQGGEAFDNLARQFNVTPEQAYKAALAVMPAFAMGLQRSMAQPGSDPFRAMLGGPFAAFWESATRANTPQARQQEQKLLDQIFNNDDVSRRVAQQAASFSGIGVDVMNQMLPLITGILAGGFARVAQQHTALMASLAASATKPPNVQDDTTPIGQSGAGAWAEYWSRWLTSESSPPRSTAMDEMAEAARDPQPPPKSKPQEDGKAPPESVASGLEQAFEAGLDLQRQHLEALQTIFDQFWGRSGKT